jgi:hypothetical protein
LIGFGFDEDDPALMGDTDAKREIKRVAEGSVLLKDIFQTPSGFIEKQKLVSFFPSQLRWTSSHLSGPNRHSQFLYAITPIVKTLRSWISQHFTSNTAM